MIAEKSLFTTKLIEAEKFRKYKTLRYVLYMILLLFVFGYFMLRKVDSSQETLFYLRNLSNSTN